MVLNECPTLNGGKLFATSGGSFVAADVSLASAANIKAKLPLSKAEPVETSAAIGFPRTSNTQNYFYPNICQKGNLNKVKF